MELKSLDISISFEVSISPPGTTEFWVGPVAAADAAIEQWAKACFGALNQGLDPSDSDGALLGLWQHPDKDLAMVAVLCSGDWVADLGGTLTNQGDEIIQLVYSGNDNDPVMFLPEFITDNHNFDGELVYDIVETVLLTVNDEWIRETLEALVEVEAQDLVERYKAKYS